MDEVAVARVCHEANRALQLATGDPAPSPPWDEAPGWQTTSAVLGVHFARENPDAPDSAQHDAWMADKIAAGWVYGEVKDAEAKTHPCLVPFDDLPPEQQAKDRLFRAIVKALS